MPESLPDHIPSPRTPLVWDGTRYRAVRGHTDGTVQVRGEGQLFSFKGVLAVKSSDNPSAADGYLDTPTVPDGEIWVVTTITGRDRTTALTELVFHNNHDGVTHSLHMEVRAIAADERVCWRGHTYLDHDDCIRAFFTGCLAGDTVQVTATGYRMTVEA